MIVRTLDDIAGSDREVVTKNWTSRRFLLKNDGMGFSLHDTVVKPGTETYMWYAHHVEAVYCVEGEGELEDIESGEVFPIRAGTLYALDGHEKHRLRARTPMRMVCVFNPALTGTEVHDEDGVYPLIEEAADARAAGPVDKPPAAATSDP
ncbi:MAG: ectoine synthase [Alphaproteobacteria bacterium]